MSTTGTGAGNEALRQRVIYAVSVIVCGLVAFLLLGPRPDGVAGAVEHEVQVALDFIGAAASHLLHGDGLDKVAPPLVILSVLVGSYLLRPSERRLV